MRFETIIASQYLVYRFEYAQVVTAIRDEGDLIVLDLKSGQRVMIVLVERGMNLAELQYHFRTNSAQNIYTLMLFWVDMILPPDGSLDEMSDWLSVMVSLHGGKVYGYEVAGRDAFFFPVYFHGKDRKRKVRFGNIVNYAAIGGEVVNTLTPYFPGEWYVAGFEHRKQQYRNYTTDEAAKRDNAIAVHFDVLGLPDNASVESVKRAYRTLARLYHPDVNETSGADERMKRINEAYQRIIKHLDSP